jgi:hypothetical protein
VLRGLLGSRLYYWLLFQSAFGWLPLLREQTALFSAFFFVYFCAFLATLFIIRMTGPDSRGKQSAENELKMEFDASLINECYRNIQK